MSQTPEATPVACNPQALGPEAWAAHQATTATLFAQAISTPHELADGYAFRFPATAFSTVAAFVEGERRCCPFFTFSVTVPPAEAAIELCITGSPEAKALIAWNSCQSTYKLEPKATHGADAERTDQCGACRRGTHRRRSRSAGPLREVCARAAPPEE